MHKKVKISIFLIAMMLSLTACNTGNVSDNDSTVSEEDNRDTKKAGKTTTASSEDDIPTSLEDETSTERDKPTDDTKKATDAPETETYSETEEVTTEPPIEETTPTPVEEPTPAPVVETTPEAPEFSFVSFTAVDNDECSIIIKDIDPDNMWGYTVKVTVENKSTEKTYRFSTGDTSINGVATDSLFYEDVAPGKKANGELNFLLSDKEEAEIGDFTDINVVFKVSDADDWSADPVVNEAIHIYPYGEDKATVYVREPQPSDRIIVDDDNFTAIITGDYMDSGEYAIDLFLTNKTDMELAVGTENESVNGYMMDPFFGRYIAPRTSMFATISWSKSDLKENDITDIETAEFSFRVYDSSDWRSPDLFNETIIVIPQK